MSPPLTPDQVATHYSVNVDTVWDWIKTGQLEAINIAFGKKKARYLITLRAMRRMERKCSTKPPAAKPKSRRRRKVVVKEYV